MSDETVNSTKLQVDNTRPTPFLSQGNTQLDHMQSPGVRVSVRLSRGIYRLVDQLVELGFLLFAPACPCVSVVESGILRDR